MSSGITRNVSSIDPRDSVTEMDSVDIVWTHCVHLSRHVSSTRKYAGQHEMQSNKDKSTMSGLSRPARGRRHYHSQGRIGAQSSSSIAAQLPL